MNQADIKQRLQALSSEKRRLLALRLGIDADTTQAEQSTSTSLSAFVTTVDLTETDTIRQHLGEYLPKYMIPSNIIILDEIPRTPNGKVDRNALLKYRAAGDEKSPLVETSNDVYDDIEQELIAIWEDLLGVEIFSLEDDFFELGGYSLLAIRMLAQVNQRFDKNLPPSIVMEASTIGTLAEHIRSDVIDLASQTIFTLQPDGTKPPIYFFQVHKYGVITYRYIAEHLGKDRPVYGVSLPQDLEEAPNTIEGLAEIFVASILAHHDPPYYLGGMSIAGLLAYETARQLQEQGVKDVHVLLFDTYGPDYPKMIPVADALTQRLMVHLKTLIDKNSDKRWYLQELLWRNWYRARFRMRRFITRYLVRLSLIDPPKVEREDYVQGSEVREWAGQKVYGEMIQLLELEERYFEEPRSYSGAVTLYRSTLQPLRASYNETLGWGRLVPSTLTVKPVRGNHSGIMRYPYVEKLAERVNQDLDQLEQTSS